MNLKNVKEIMIPEGLNKETTVANTSTSFYSSTAQSSYIYLNSYSTSDSNLGQSDLLKINFTVISNQGSPYIESQITYVDENGTTRYPEFTINGTTNFDLTIKLSREVDSNTWEVLLLEQYDQNANTNYIRVQLTKTNSGDLGIYIKNDVAIKMFTLQINNIKTINNIGVKTITNSNGNVIWGSQEAFPYRRLEYIHLNGNEYLWSQITTKAGFYRQLVFDLERKDVRQCPIGCYDAQSSSENNRRFFVLDFDPSNGVRGAIGNTWSTATSINNIPLNTKMRLGAVSSIVNNNNRLVFNLVDISTSTAINIISNTTINGTSATLTNIQAYIGGCRTRNSNGITSLTSPMKGKIYYYEERETNYQGNFTHQRYPAQRKSDGKCGLYDVTTNTFEIMNGTDIYDTAAGPVVDEYWDLTAPA